MSPYFSADYPGNAFRFFSLPHWLAIMVLFSLYGLLFLFRDRLRRQPLDTRIRYGLATLLILQELSLNLWRIGNGTWSIATSLPLHLCGVAVLLSAVMLVNRN